MIDEEKGYLDRARDALGERAGIGMLKAEQERQEQLARDVFSSAYKFTSAATRDKLFDQLTSVKRAAEQLGFQSSTPNWAREPNTVAYSRRQIEDDLIQRAPLLPPQNFAPERTVIGKATLESAAHAKDTAQSVTELARTMGALNTTLTDEVFPQWFETVQSSQADTKKALRLAWIAIIVSAVTAVGATFWQIMEARAMDAENSEQQARVERLLREQLANQQRLIEMQAAAMRLPKPAK